ncbi:MAG: D-glycero-beta-D-manno-heptose 1-phosphate adenylyltransferase [Deltaproteobacteria bacterium]|nr:D-glycero-beta-D-manno-heptose 1-phosphate adenylyltransferase [Deltaproteobacteria bacterium]MBW2071054.1 D-glycero-beta-D-manno-heptose 1-phosphate adenylyltransferase [Deltaproteobacteria bacterium]
MIEPGRKVLDRSELRRQVHSLHTAGKQIVFTNGCFDLLHIGHIRYLHKARCQGDRLVVAVNSDRSVRELKGPPRPIVPEDERAEIVAALAAVDLVTIFDELDPLELVRQLKPDVLVKGADWQRQDIVGASEVEAAGGRVVRVKLEPHISSSILLQRIASEMATGYGTGGRKDET